MPGEVSTLEIQPFYEADDFGEVLTPELRAQEDWLPGEIERREKS